MENIMVLLIVVVAAAYVFKTFYKGSREGASCNCGCDTCDTASDCTDILAEGPGNIRSALSEEAIKQLRS